MGLFPILPLFGAVTLFIMAAFVYTRNKSSPINATYALFLSSLILWLIGMFVSYLAKNQQSAYFWQKIGYSGVVFLPSMLYGFVVEFLSIKKLRFFSIIKVIISIGFVILLWASNLFVDGTWAYNLGFYYIKASILQSYFLIFFAICFAETYVLMFLKYFENKQRGHLSECNRISYVIMAILVGNFGAIDFIPMYGIRLWPFGFLFVTIMVGIFAYAIVKHQLMGIEVIIKKTLVFAGLFTAAYAAFAFFALLGQMFFERFITQNRWVSMIPSVIVVTLAFRPLETFLINLTDKFLFQKRYDYKELIKTFVSEVLTVLDLNSLTKLTEKRLAEIMKLEYCRMIIGEKIDINIDVPLKLPISVDNNPMGMLLFGKKKSDEEYNQDDVNILQALAKTLGIAISNARLVEELGKAQIEAAQKDKMATVGTLAAGMAHEIRNPTTTIRVFSEYVPDRLNDDKFRNKYRDIIAKEVGKIDHIIQALIDFSGEEGIKEISSVSLHKATEEFISIISQGQDVLGRIRLINNIPPDIARIDINKEELDEIILNLTQNAIHAIADNGTITFSAEEKERSVVLKISDTGCGISEETIKHIFNPFFTTKLKGFGLGLFVVNELIQRNNGKISVKSALNKGTIFYLEFKKII